MWKGFFSSNFQGNITLNVMAGLHEHRSKQDKITAS